jgi:hypothetical protein
METSCQPQDLAALPTENRSSVPIVYEVSYNPEPVWRLSRKKRTLPGIKPPFLLRPSRSLVAALTELSRLSTYEWGQKIETETWTAYYRFSVLFCHVKCTCSAVPTCRLSPWRWAFLERPPVMQLLKNFPAFCGTLKVHYLVHKSPPLVPILSQTKPVNTTPYSLSL